MGLIPSGQGVGVGHLRRLVVSGHQIDLGRIEQGGGVTQVRLRNRHQQVPHGSLVGNRPHELWHHPQCSTDRHRSRVGSKVAGEQTQQCRFACSVRSHQGNGRSVTDPKGHVIQEGPTVRQVILQMRNLHVAHGRILSPR